MKILFVLGKVFPNDDANSMIINRLADQILAANTDVSIYMIGSSESGQLESEIHNGVKIIRIDTRNKHEFSHMLTTYLEGMKYSNRMQKITELIKKPPILIEFMLKRFLPGGIISCYSKAIRYLCEAEKINIVVGVTFPFYTCLSTVKARAGIPFIYYQLDPYSHHYLQPDKERSLRKESFVCDRATHIIMTDLIKKDYQNSILQKYLKKSSVMCFPAIENLSNKYHTSKSLKNTDNSIKIVFVGTIYSDIRSPLFFLKLIHELIRRGQKINVDFVGPLVGVLCKETTEYLNKLGSLVTFHNRVSADEAIQWMLNADVLVNIGNKISNQMPSKIFEYFSTGNPIINIHKTNECPTLAYTSKYPYCINVLENRFISNYVIDKIENFILTYKGKRLVYEQVELIFPEFTVRAVSEEFMKVINGII